MPYIEVLSDPVGRLVLGSIEAREGMVTTKGTIAAIRGQAIYMSEKALASGLYYRASQVSAVYAEGMEADSSFHWGGIVNQVWADAARKTMADRGWDEERTAQAAYGMPVSVLRKVLALYPPVPSKKRR
jgi:hypothetical protein